MSTTDDVKVMRRLAGQCPECGASVSLLIWPFETHTCPEGA